MKNKPITKSSKTFFTRAFNFLAKTLKNTGYIARRLPGHIFKITGSRILSFVSIGLMIGASVTTSAIVPFVIGASILTVQTVIKVRQIVKVRKLYREAKLASEFATKLYFQKKIFELAPKLSPLKKHLSKVELVDDNKHDRKKMIEKYTNAVSNSLYYVNRGVNIAATIINPTPIKITRQSFDLIKAIIKGEATQSTESSHSQLVEGIASDADEQIKLMEFIKQNAAFGDSAINIKTLPEKIQQLDNENKALLGVIKDESFSKYDPQGKALSNEQLKEKYINNLTEAQKNSMPTVKETRFQASKAVAKEFLYGVIGAFNPYNTYIHAMTDTIKPKEEIRRRTNDDIEVKLGTNDSGTTLQEARESLQASADTLTKDLQDIRNKKAEQKAKKRSIWGTVKSIKQALEYGIYKVESTIDRLFYPDGHSTEELRTSDFTRMARQEEKEGAAHNPNSLGNALIDLPVKPFDNKKKGANIEARVETKILNSSTLSPEKNTFNKLTRKNITKPLQGKKKERKTNRNNWKDSIQDQRIMNTREPQKGG